MSANICGDLEPEYMDIVDDLTTMLLKVADASERDSDFRKRLRDGGIQFTAHLRPMAFIRDLAELRSSQSMLARWVQDGIDHGVIDQAHIPAPWRDRWFGDQPSMRR